MSSQHVVDQDDILDGFDNVLDKLGTHYKENGIDVIEACEKGLLSEEELRGFMKGNIIKYIVRYDKKGTPIEDLHKTKDYIERLILIETKKVKK
jgi:hypothetical protein